ncbi:MAG TPA: hypothetical protein VKU80_17890 [Planctomycetota bacterium]|nr:hypothetical protein [Planctomycetota bacterium]
MHEEGPDRLNAVAASTSALRTATAGAGGAISLWALRTGAAVGKLSGHDDDVLSLASSPDGRFLASGGKDRTLRIWEWASGSATKVIREGFGPVQSISYSWSGQLLAAGTSDGKVMLWDCKAGRLTQLHASPGDELLQVCFASDDKSVVLGCRRGALRRLDIDSGEIRTLIPDTQGELADLAVSSDGETLAYCTKKGHCVVLGMPSGRPLYELEGSHAAIAPDSRTLVVSSGDLRVINMTTGQEVQRFDTRGRIANSLRFVPGESDQFLTSNDDGTALLWSLSSKAPAAKPFGTGALEDRWNDLRETNQARACSAMTDLVSGGNETVQFIKTHLRFESEDPVRVSMLIRQLEDEDGGVRERSERELRGMDSQLALKRRLSDPCPTDLRLRIESVMKEMDALPIAAGKILLGLRAIHVLERIGSSEAQSLLLDIASSAPGRRSRDAFASAQRLRALSPR